MASSNRLQEVLSGVVNSSEDISVAFGISSPKDDNLIKVVLCLESTIMEIYK